MTEYFYLKNRDLVNMAGCETKVINNSKYCVKNLEDFKIEDMMNLNNYIQKNETVKFMDGKSGGELFKYINDYYFEKQITKLGHSGHDHKKITTGILGTDQFIYKDAIMEKINNETIGLTKHIAEKFVFIPRGSGEVEDKGWGCAWRAIQTQLGNYFKTPPSMGKLFYYFGNQSIINELYTKAYNLPCEIKSPHIKGTGWADPYIGYLIMLYFNLPTTFIMVSNIEYSNKYITQFNENIKCIKSDKYLDIIKKFFREEKKSIMVDNGTFAASILGYHVKDNKDCFWIADPHRQYQDTPEETIKKGIYFQNQGTYTSTNTTYMVNFPAYVKFKYDDLCEDDHYKYILGSTCKVTHYSKSIASCEIEGTEIKNIKTIAGNEFIRKLMVFVSHKKCETDTKSTYIIKNPDLEIKEICKSIGWKENGENLEYSCQAHEYVCGKNVVPGGFRKGTSNKSCWFDTMTMLLFMPTHYSRYFRKMIFEFDAKDPGLKDIIKEYKNLVERGIEGQNIEQCTNLMLKIYKTYKEQVWLADHLQKSLQNLASSQGGSVLEYLNLLKNMFGVDLFDLNFSNFRIDTGFLFKLKNKPKLGKDTDINLFLGILDNLPENIDNFIHNPDIIMGLIIDKYIDFDNYFKQNYKDIINAITMGKINNLTNSDIQTLKNFGISTKNKVQFEISKFKFLNKYYEKYLNHIEMKISSDLILIFSGINLQTKFIKFTEDMIVSKEKYILEAVLLERQFGIPHLFGFLKCNNKWYKYDNQTSPYVSGVDNYKTVLNSLLNLGNYNLNFCYIKSFPSYKN